MNKAELLQKALEDGADININFHCSSKEKAEMKMKSFADVLDLKYIYRDRDRYGVFTSGGLNSGQIEVSVFYNKKEETA